MSIDKLLKEGKLHQFKATQDEIEKPLEIAERDLAVAEKIFEEDLDWSFSIAYNAILQACRAYMFSLGYRPASSEMHKTVFEFMEVMSEDPHKEMIAYFDRARRKRHRTLYDEVGLVSTEEVLELLKQGGTFIAEMGMRLRT